MNPQTYIDLIPKIGRLLSNKNTYYVLFLAVLGFWLWKDENTIIELKTDIKKSDSLCVDDKKALQSKIDSKNCAEEIRGVMQLLKDFKSNTTQQAGNEERALELEKKRTDELQKTYQLLKINK
jgi:hypothetical protein